MFKVLAATALVALVGVFAGTASAQQPPRQLLTITSATVTPDRHISVVWNALPGEGLSLADIYVAKNPSQASDHTFYSENRVAEDYLGTGASNWISTGQFGAGTYYVVVTGYWEGYSDSDYTNYGDVYSNVATVVVPPLCVKQLKIAGHYLRILKSRGHYNAKGYWIKPVYKKVWIKPVYKTVCS